MSRFSPQVGPDTGDQLRGFGNDLADALEERRYRRRQESIDADRIADRDRIQREDDERREVNDLALERSGIHRGTAPPNQAYVPGKLDFGSPLEFPEFHQPRTDENPIPTPGQRMFGRQSLSAGAGDDSLADDLTPFLGARGGGEDGEPTVTALPGQFIPGVGFTPKAIISAPPARRQASYTPSQMARTNRQLAPNFYETAEETPEYMAHQEEQRGLADDLERFGQRRKAAVAAGMPERQADMLEFYEPSQVRSMFEERAPVRGTPEYNKMFEQEEAIRSRNRPPTSGTDNGPTSTSLLTSRVQAVRDAVNAISGLERQRGETDQAFAARQLRQLQLHGFDSEEALREEQRAVRRIQMGEALGESSTDESGADYGVDIRGNRTGGAGRSPLRGGEAGLEDMSDPLIIELNDALAHHEDPQQILADMVLQGVDRELIERARRYLGAP